MLSSYAATNFGLVSLLKAHACDPDWFVCRAFPAPYPLAAFAGNQGVLQKARDWFEVALKLQPGSDALRLHLAETAFAQGDRQKAVQYLAEIKTIDPARSPLMQDQRYEARIVNARQEAAQGDWQAAVRDFRLGLAWGDERTLPVDEQDYFRALAEVEKANFTKNRADIDAIYRAGRYLAQAGDWQAAVSYLERSEIMLRLPPRQAAWALTTLGRFNEAQGDVRSAIASYQYAILMDPALRQPALRLLPLLKVFGADMTADQIEQSLVHNGPTYRIGAQGEFYQYFVPITVLDGWTLIGYDLDEEMLEQAKSLEIYLWWQSDGKRPKGEGWTKVGDYWVQRQVVKNLFPNAGFEWGANENGIPLGHDHEFYNAPVGSLVVETKNRAGLVTQVAAANNSPSVHHVALVSRKIPVDLNSQYLMGGWIWDQGGSATIGRSCNGQGPDPISPYYLFGYQQQPLQTWVHYAYVSEPFPGFNSEACEALLMNDANSESPAFWDNVLWVRIQNP